MLRRLLIVVLGLVFISTAHGQLKIDFTQNANNIVEPGFQAWYADQEVLSSFVPQSYSAFGATVTVSANWAPGAVDTVAQMYYRTGGNYVWTGGHDNLIRDWIGTDNRSAGNPLTITLSGLPAGVYEWKSYHHDGDNQTGLFDVTLNDAAGTSTFNDIDITDTRVTDLINDFDFISVFMARIVCNGSPVTLTFSQQASSPTDQAFFVMNGFELTEVDTSLAFGPDPINGATDVQIPPILKWIAGDGAAATNGHKVFLSDNLADVESGAAGADQGTVSSAQFDTSSLGLTYDTTYYWRVDESTTPGGPFTTPGDVWSFTTEPYSLPIPGADIGASASSSSDPNNEGPEKTIDGSGLDENGLHSATQTDMWLSNTNGPQPTWIQYDFDKLYKLDKMLVWNHNTGLESTFGLGIKEAVIEYSTDGETWSTLGTTHEFARAPGTAGYAANTTVDFEGLAAQHVRITANSNWGGLVTQYGLSEVRFYYVPVRARDPQPASGATGVDPDVVLSWRPGIDAAEHQVLFSADEDAVADGTAPATSAAGPSFDPGDLLLATTYYWQVNEINNAETPSVWPSDIWSFTTASNLVVDNMESYGDANTPGPPPPAGSRIWYTWRDGGGWSNPSEVQGNGSGSYIGHADAPFVETSIRHGGSQSMPFYYNNDGAVHYSEATASISDLAIGNDWTKGGAKALVLWFFGDANNIASSVDQMYVKINGVKVPYEGDMSIIKQGLWHEWDIDLTSLSGVDLTNVTQISIGFGDENNTVTAGGSGIVYFDDIALYPSRCRAAVSQPGADLNDDCIVDFGDIQVLAAQWLTDGHRVTPSQPSDTGLIAYYEFEGNANDSTGANNATTTGGPTYTTGVMGQAILLDGLNDYVLANGEYNLTTYTASAWFRTDRATGDQRDIFSVYDDNGGHGLLLELRTNGELRVLHRAPLGTGGGSDIYTPTGDGERYDDGNWHHVVIVKSADTIKGYVDGAVVGSADDSTSFGAPLQWIAIGVLKDTALGRYFPGAIDDVRFYNRPLSQDEVAWLGGRTEPFSARFDMNEDGSVDLRDFSLVADQWLDKIFWP